MTTEIKRRILDLSPDRIPIKKKLHYIPIKRNVTPSYYIEAFSFGNIGVNVGDDVLYFPHSLSHIAEEIEKSKFILKLKKNWDDNAAKPINKKTYLNAINFLANLSRNIYTKCDFVIDAPKIFPSSDGAVDIFWRKDGYRLIMKVPENSDTLNFYGESGSSISIHGKMSFDAHQHPLALLCLLRNQ